MAIHDYIVNPFRNAGNVVAREFQYFSRCLCHILGFGKHWNSLCLWKGACGYSRNISLDAFIHYSKGINVPHSLLNESIFLLAADAQVSLTMEDVVEVYTGDSAVIRCQYNFAQDPNMVMVQWFVVCTIPQHFHFACQLIGSPLAKTTVASILNYVSLNLSVVLEVEEWGSLTVTSPCRRWTRTRPTRTASASQGTPAARTWPSWTSDSRTKGSFSARSTALQRATEKAGPT